MQARLRLETVKAQGVDLLGRANYSPLEPQRLSSHRERQLSFVSSLDRGTDVGTYILYEQYTSGRGGLECSVELYSCYMRGADLTGGVCPDQASLDE